MSFVVVKLALGTLIALAPLAAAAQTPGPLGPSAAPGPATPAPVPVSSDCTNPPRIDGLSTDTGAGPTSAAKSQDGRFFAFGQPVAQITASVFVPLGFTATLAVDGAAAVTVANGSATVSPGPGFHHTFKLVASDTGAITCPSTAHLFTVPAMSASPVFDSNASLHIGGAADDRRLSLAFAPSSGDNVLVTTAARIGPALRFHIEFGAQFDTAQLTNASVSARVLDGTRDLFSLGGVSFKNACAGFPIPSGTVLSVTAPQPVDAPPVTFLGAELLCERSPTLIVRSKLFVPLLAAQPIAASVSIDDRGVAPQLVFDKLGPIKLSEGVSLADIAGARTTDDWVISATLRFPTLGLGTQAPVALTLKQRRLAFVAASPEQAIPIALDNGNLILGVRRFECGLPAPTAPGVRATCSGMVAVTLPTFGGSLVAASPLLVDFNADRGFDVTTNGGRSITFGRADPNAVKSTVTLDTFTAKFLKPTNYSISGSGSFSIDGWLGQSGVTAAAANRTFKIDTFSIVRVPEKTEAEVRLGVTSQTPITIAKDILKITTLTAALETDEHGSKVLKFADAGAVIGDLGIEQLKDFSVTIGGVRGSIHLNGSKPTLDFKKATIVTTTGALFSRDVIGRCEKPLGPNNVAPQLFDLEPDSKGRPGYNFCIGVRLMESGSVLTARDKVNADVRVSFDDKKQGYGLERAELSMTPNAKPFIVRVGSRAMSVSDIDVLYSRDEPSLLPELPDGTHRVPTFVTDDGVCDPFLRGSMTISTDAIISAQKQSTISPEVFFGKSCLFGMADGIIYIDMGTNASATLRSLKFAVAPRKNDSTKTMAHLEAAGDLYVQSAVVSFNRLGFHSGERFQSFQSVNIPSTVQNNVIRNFSGLAALLGGFIGKLVLH